MGNLVSFLCHPLVWRLLVVFGIMVGIAICNRFFKKLKVKLGVFALLMMYGIFVRYEYRQLVKEVRPPIPKSVALLDAINSTLQPARAAYEKVMNEHADLKKQENPPNLGSNTESSPEPKKNLKIDFHLFHLLFYVYTIWFALSIFASRMMNNLSRCNPFYRRRFIFFGAGESARLLAKDVFKKKGWKKGWIRRWTTACYFCLDSKLKNDHKLFTELDEMGFIVIYENLDDAKVRASFAKRRFSRYLFLDDDDDFNVRMAVSILNAFEDEPPKRRIDLYVRTETERIDNFFPKNGGSGNDDKKSKVDLHIFNPADLMARHFISAHPMYDCPPIAVGNGDTHRYDYNVLLLGFGWQGRELLKKCICDSQFNDRTFAATVIERDYKSKYGYYPVMFDECIKNYALTFNPHDDSQCPHDVSSDVNSDAFYRWFNDNWMRFNRILVALGDDKTNVEIATMIARMLTQKGKNRKECRELIFVHVSYNRKHDCHENGKAPFTLFGNVEKIYTHDVVINEVEDHIAKMVNYVYACMDSRKEDFAVFSDGDRMAAEAGWKTTSLFDKDSSRAVAQSIKSFVHRTVETGKDGVRKEIQELSDKDMGGIVKHVTNDMEMLARNEHRRWNAFHYTNGIRRWSKGEIQPAGGKIRAKLCDDNDNPLKHGCLVDFKDLDEISEIVNGLRRKNGQEDKANLNYADVDRCIVRHFPLFIKEAQQKKSWLLPR